MVEEMLKQSAYDSAFKEELVKAGADEGVIGKIWNAGKNFTAKRTVAAEASRGAGLKDMAEKFGVRPDQMNQLGQHRQQEKILQNEIGKRQNFTTMIENDPKMMRKQQIYEKIQSRVGDRKVSTLGLTRYSQRDANNASEAVSKRSEQLGKQREGFEKTLGQVQKRIDPLAPAEQHFNRVNSKYNEDINSAKQTGQMITIGTRVGAGGLAAGALYAGKKMTQPQQSQY